jgi:hypothetical protein
MAFRMEHNIEIGCISHLLQTPFFLFAKRGLSSMQKLQSHCSDLGHELHRNENSREHLLFTNPISHSGQGISAGFALSARRMQREQEHHITVDGSSATTTFATDAAYSCVGKMSATVSACTLGTCV